jgi:hypothetical protein
MRRTIGFSTFCSRFVIASIASITLSVVVAGCSSSSDSGSDAGTDAGPTICTQTQVDTIFSRSCTVCHDSTGLYAGLNLTSNGLAGRLLGVAPAGGGTVSPSVCTGMSKIYLVQGSKPAQGLLIDKIGPNPGCGVRMPYSLPPLNNTDIACIQSWATTVTSP